MLADLGKARLKPCLAAIILCLFVRVVEASDGPAASILATASVDLGLERVVIPDRVAGVTDTRRVVASLVVGERAPLGAGVDDAVAHDETTLRADQVSRRELLNQSSGCVAVLALDDVVQISLVGRHVWSTAGGRHLCAGAGFLGGRSVAKFAESLPGSLAPVPARGPEVSALLYDRRADARAWNARLCIDDGCSKCAEERRMRLCDGLGRRGRRPLVFVVDAEELAVKRDGGGTARSRQRQIPEFAVAD